MPAAPLDPWWRRAAPLVGWLVALVVVAVGFGALGRGALAGPDLTAPGTWSAWAAGRTPVEAAFAVLRLAVIVVAWYLLAVTLLAVATRAGRAGRLVTAVDVVTIPMVRRMVQGALGVGMVGAAVAGVGAGQLSAEAPGPRTAADSHLAATAHAHGDLGGGDVLRRLPADVEGAPVMQRLPDDAPAAPAAESAAPEWEVAPGDHLWSVAERVLAESWGRPVVDDEVAPYWRTVVEVNADRLADPANPDLVFPGQRLALPTPPPAPAG